MWATGSISSKVGQLDSVYKLLGTDSGSNRIYMIPGYALDIIFDILIFFRANEGTCGANNPAQRWFADVVSAESKY